MDASELLRGRLAEAITIVSMATLCWACDTRFPVAASPPEGLPTADCNFDVESSAPNPTADPMLVEQIAAVMVGEEFHVDGSGSLPSTDGEAIARYHWEPARRPPGSTAWPSSDEGPRVAFTPDVAGSYGLELSVCDTLGKIGRAMIWVSFDSSGHGHSTSIERL